MKKNILYILYIILAAVILAMTYACSPTGIQRERFITFTPDSLTVIPDSNNQASINLQVNIPKHYFSKRSRLFIIPVLRDSDSTIAEYKPLVLDAPIYSKKAERKWVLEHIADPYATVAQKVKDSRKAFTTHYSDTLQLPASMRQGQLMALVSADGCGTCQAISHAKMADIHRPEPVKRDFQQEVQQEVVARPEIKEGMGIVHLQFAINQYDIDLKMGNNEAELNRMLSDIAPILSDSLADLKSLTICGLASADGFLKFNTALARNRANAAKDWLIAHLEHGEKLSKLASITSRPEGWQPVLDAMSADGNADSIQVKRILTQYAAYDDDIQEKYIRRLPIWNIIKEKYLPKDRKVVYRYTYTIGKKE